MQCLCSLLGMVLPLDATTPQHATHVTRCPATRRHTGALAPPLCHWECQLTAVALAGSEWWVVVGVRDILSVRAIRMEVSQRNMSTCREVFAPVPGLIVQFKVWAALSGKTNSTSSLCALLLIQMLGTVTTNHREAQGGEVCSAPSRPIVADWYF